MSSKCGNDFCSPLEHCVQGSCVACFDCALYNRLPSPEGCAKLPDECGSCFIGFYEVPVTTVVNTKPCEEKSKNLPESSIKFYKSQINVELIFGLLTFAIICVTYLLVKKYKNKTSNCHTMLQVPFCFHRTSDINPVLNEKQAPEYSSAQKASFNPLHSANFSVDPVKKQSDEEFFSVNFVREKRQNAVKYKEPTAPYYWELHDEVDGELRPSNSRQLTNYNLPSIQVSVVPNGEIAGQSGVASNSQSVNPVMEEAVRNETNHSIQNEFGH